MLVRGGSAAGELVGCAGKSRPMVSASASWSERKAPYPGRAVVDTVTPPEAPAADMARTMVFGAAPACHTQSG